MTIRVIMKAGLTVFCLQLLVICHDLFVMALYRIGIIVAYVEYMNNAAALQYAIQTLTLLVVSIGLTIGTIWYGLLFAQVIDRLLNRRSP